MYPKNKIQCYFKYNFILQGRHSIPVYFVPNIEKEKGNEETFLPDNPINIMSEGKFNHVPLILGYTAEEGKIMLKGKIKGKRMFSQ